MFITELLNNNNFWGGRIYFLKVDVQISNVKTKKSIYLL